jgi:hypothetical protein
VVKIKVKGKEYKVNVPSSPIIKGIFKNQSEELVIGSVTPYAPAELLPEFEKVWKKEYNKKRESKKVKSKNKEWVIKSSKGDSSYVVEQNEEGNFTCSCKGFKFRRNCRHIEEVKKKEK